MREANHIPPRQTKVVHIYGAPFHAYIGSPHDEGDPRELRVGEYGFLGNPFTDGTPEENLARFEAYFRERVRSDRRFRLAVLSLYGRNLGCICDGESCHGEVIADWLEEQRSQHRAWFGALPPSVRG